ncbi:hypothetical protein CRM22_002711 [Opisthorchis felineus]|uniref:Neurotransmitter-gated ion-channel ligand-binding domain-containing protein n=1 Tax=Opisthorchis felineus TaxID=147828 RepID=A0A4S2M997_OPIFE|nr:hypothetical protein CRM22_002711 [Opisthorchis felineus]
MVDYIPVGAPMSDLAEIPHRFSIEDNTESTSKCLTLINDVESVLSRQTESGLSLDDPGKKEERQSSPPFMNFSSNTLVGNHTGVRANPPQYNLSIMNLRLYGSSLPIQQNDKFLTSSSSETTFRGSSRPLVCAPPDPTELLTTNRTRRKLSATRRIPLHPVHRITTEAHRTICGPADATTHERRYFAQPVRHREFSHNSLAAMQPHNTTQTDLHRRWSYFVEDPARQINPSLEEDLWTVGSASDADGSIPSPSSRTRTQNSLNYVTGKSSPLYSFAHLNNAAAESWNRNRSQFMQPSESPVQLKTPNSFAKPMGSSSTLAATRHPFPRAEHYNICSTYNSSEEKLSAKSKTVRWAGKPAGFQSANTSRMDSPSKFTNIHSLTPFGYRESSVSSSLSQIMMNRSTPHSEYDPGLDTTEYGIDMGDYWSIHPNGSSLGNRVGQPVEEQAHSVTVDRHPRDDSQAASPCVPQKGDRGQTKTLKRQDSETKRQTKMLRTQGRCFPLDSSTVQSPVCKEYQPSELTENSPETESLIQALELLCASVEENNRSYELELRELDPLMMLRRRFLGSTTSDNSQHRTSLLNSRTVRTRGQRHDQLRRAAGHRRSEDSGQNRTDKVAVEVRVVFLKIGEIDTLKELYYADAFIQAKWREPKLDGRVTEELTITELEQYWNPLLFIDNILSETKETQWLVAQENDAGEVFLVERRRIKGVFLETLELNDFPLDVQDLTITVTTERPDTEVDIIPDQNEMSAINIQTFVDQQEWKLHEHVEITKRIIKQEYSSSMKSHPCLSVTCRAARRPGYFYWNVFLIMFMISGLSFATFAVSPDKAELRLRLSFTLILTSVTFKYVITQSLPKISYLTYMDKYVLMSLAILCIISIWHAVVTLLDPQHIAIRNGQSGELSDTFDFTTPKIPTQFADNTSRGTLGNSKWKAADPFRNTTGINGDNSTEDFAWNNTIVAATVLEPECTPTNLMACKEWKEVQKVEQHVFTSFVIIYIIAHAIFIFWLYFDASRRRREMRQKDRDYRKRKRKMVGRTTHE